MARPLSFRARLTLRWTIAFGLLLAGASVTVYLGVRAYAQRDFDATLRTLAATEIASSTDAGGLLHLHEPAVDDLGDGDFAGKFVQYYALDGSIVFESAVLRGERVLDATQFASALAGHHGVAVVDLGGRTGRVVTAHMRDTSARYVAAVGLFTDELDRLLSRLARILGVVWVLGVAATAWIGFVLASRALEPIDAITARAARIATGDIDMRLDAPRIDDEIGRMTRLLNEMLDRLHRVIDGSRRFAADASHELRSPLTAMAGEIDVALRRERAPQEYRETLQRLREQIDGLTTVTEHLMLLARAEEQPDELAAEEVPVRDLVEAACTRLAPQAARTWHLADPCGTRRPRRLCPAGPAGARHRERHRQCRAVQPRRRHGADHRRRRTRARGRLGSRTRAHRGHRLGSGHSCRRVGARVRPLLPARALPVAPHGRRGPWPGAESGHRDLARRPSARTRLGRGGHHVRARPPRSAARVAAPLCLGGS